MTTAARGNRNRRCTQMNIARASPATQVELTQRRKGAKDEFFAGFAPLREVFLLGVLRASVFVSGPLGRPRRGTSGAILLLALPVMLIGACKKQTDDGADAKVASLGAIEVIARVAEIAGLDKWAGKFPSNDLGYDYVYVVKYDVLDVHRGNLAEKAIVVGHYNPLKPRAEAADARCPDIGGNVERIRVGDVHRLALDIPIDEHYMGPMINPYFQEGAEQTVYWAVWTNRVVR